MAECNEVDITYSVILVCKCGEKCIEAFRKRNRMVLELNNSSMSRRGIIFLLNYFSRRNEGKHSNKVKLFELLIVAKFPCFPFQGKLSLPPFLRLPASSNFLSLSFHKKTESCLAEKRKSAYMSRSASEPVHVNA